jgi:hypothetical protein
MEQKGREQNSDEIDLRQLFQSIGDFFTRIGNGILNGIVGVRKATYSNKRIFGAAILFCLMLAAAYKLLFPPLYESTLLLRSSYMDTRYLQNEIDKLNKLTEEEELGALQRTLNIDKATAEQIVELELVPYLSEEEVLEIRLTKERLEDVEDLNPAILERLARYFEYENRRMFQISVTTKDPTVFQPLEEGLVEYLKGDDFVSRRLQINRVNLMARRKKLVEETSTLDSLKDVLFENLASMAKEREGGSNNVILSDRYLTNPLEVFSRDLELNNQILQIDQQLFLEPEFEVIDGFTAVYRPINPGWLKSIAIAIAAGIILAYLVIIFKAIDAYLDKVEREGIA